MSDYIRKQDAINVAQNYHCSHDITIIPNTDYRRGFYDGLAIRENDILQGLSELKPSADVAPVVHSTWIEDECEGYHGIHCLWCGFSIPYGNVMMGYKFCPNCGAKMDGRE